MSSSPQDDEGAPAREAGEAADPPRPRRSKKEKAGSAKAARAGTTATTTPAPKQPAPIPAFVGIALIAGAAGWFAHGFVPSTPGRGGTAVSALPSAAPSSSSGAAPTTPAECKSWSDAVCTKAGAQSEGCKSAAAAAKLLPAAACLSAMPGVDETVGRLAAARGACSDLVSRLCAELGEQTDTCKMVRDKTGSFPTSRCEEMLAQFPSVLEELKRVEAENAPLSAEVAAKQRAGDAPGFGPADAKVAVVLYSDFQCPYCARAVPTVHALEKKYGDKVRFVFRQFPLSFHENAKPTAEGSLAAHAQGKFWAFHDEVFENQGALDRASLEKYAAKAGLDVARFKKELDQGKHAARVDADMKLGEEIGVSGTPTMIVGTRRVSDPTDVEAISKLVDEELAR